MLLTALVGMLLAQGGTPPALAILSGLAGIGACAGGAAVINHLLDARRDAVMSRTSHRPLPQGRVRPGAAWLFAAALCAGGFALLWLAHNPLAAVLTAAALLGYAFLYTLVLKPLTPQNIVIGGISGAMPPLLGWVAIGGDLHPQPLLLVALIFVWTPAHFWALAMHKPEDYENTGVPLLQLVHGEAYTRLSITLYAALTLGVSLLYFAAGFGGPVYLAGALGLGAYFLLSALHLQRNPSRAPRHAGLPGQQLVPDADVRPAAGRPLACPRCGDAFPAKGGMRSER